MTEFTSEFIAEQRNIIKQGTMTVQEMKVNNEIDLYINMMYRRAKTEHCEKYYPDALDEIEKLQQRVQELEQERQWIPVSDAAVFELERGFYLYEDERGAHMIGLFNFTDRNLLGATKIYSMKLYPPHLKNIPQPTKEDI